LSRLAKKLEVYTDGLAIDGSFFPPYSDLMIESRAFGVTEVTVTFPLDSPYDIVYYDRSYRDVGDAPW
jgi:hypothetical protein